MLREPFITNTHDPDSKHAFNDTAQRNLPTESTTKCTVQTAYYTNRPHMALRFQRLLGTPINEFCTHITINPNQYLMDSYNQGVDHIFADHS